MQNHSRDLSDCGGPLRTVPRFYKTAVDRQTIFRLQYPYYQRKAKNESTLIFNLTVAFEPEILESLKKFKIFRKIFNLNGGFEQKP